MVDLKRLQDLHDRATPVGWDVQPTSSGGVLLKRGKEYPLAERHPQTHLQVVPGVDGELMAEVRNALPELLRLAAVGLAVEAECPGCGDELLTNPNATVVVFKG
jgi:predicted metalloenzyme YecM